MNTSFFVVLSFFCFADLSIAQSKVNFMPQTTLATIPGRLQELVKDKIIRVDEVDFTGDGKTDYICYTGYAEDNKAHDYWITSRYKMVKKRTYTHEVNEVRFVNIDADPEPEIINVFGDAPNKIAYVFLDQNLRENKEDTLFFFIPIVVLNHTYYSVYIGGLTDMPIRKVRKRAPMISCVFEHGIRKKKYPTSAKKQSVLPLVLFTGQGIKPLKMQGLPTFQWHSLQQIRERLGL